MATRAALGSTSLFDEGDHVSGMVMHPPQGRLNGPSKGLPHSVDAALDSKETIERHPVSLDQSEPILYNNSSIRTGAIFRQTTRGPRLLKKCNGPHEASNCPRRKIEEYGRHPAGSAPSLPGASTTTTVTDFGPPTPKNGPTYATVTRSPWFGQESFPMERMPYAGDHRKRRHGLTSSIESELAAMVMDPPRGPTKGPPSRTAAPAAEPGSDSEGSRRRSRRPPPIDSTYPFTNHLPIPVRNDDVRNAAVDDDNESCRDKEAKYDRDARAAATDRFREEERRREMEEKAKDEYYAKYELARGDYRAEERARKARERLERERMEREESDDYAKGMAARERAREEAREEAREWALEEPRQPSPARTSSEYIVSLDGFAAEVVARSPEYTQSRAEKYLEQLRKLDRRQATIERSDREHQGQTSNPQGPEADRLMSMKERSRRADVLAALAEHEARVARSQGRLHLVRDNKGKLAQVRGRPKLIGGAGKNGQKWQARIFNSSEPAEPADKGPKSENQFQTTEGRLNEDEANSILNEEAMLHMKSDNELLRESQEQEEDDELIKRRIELQLLKRKVEQEEGEDRISHEEERLKNKYERQSIEAEHKEVEKTEK